MMTTESTASSGMFGPRCASVGSSAIASGVAVAEAAGVALGVVVGEVDGDADGAGGTGVSVGRTSTSSGVWTSSTRTSGTISGAAGGRIDGPTCWIGCSGCTGWMVTGAGAGAGAGGACTGAGTGSGAWVGSGAGAVVGSAGAGVVRIGSDVGVGVGIGATGLCVGGPGVTWAVDWPRGPSSAHAAAFPGAGHSAADAAGTPRIRPPTRTTAAADSVRFRCLLKGLPSLQALCLRLSVYRQARSTGTGHRAGDPHERRRAVRGPAPPRRRHDRPRPDDGREAGHPRRRTSPAASPAGTRSGPGRACGAPAARPR